MSKHTPGPWIVEYEGKQEWVIVAPDGDHTLGYHRWDGLASVYGSIDDKSNGIVVGQANASLIAAAPDMLNALEEAERAISSGLKDTDAVLGIIRSAIKKAEGR